jgi:hypothetical protein
MSELDKLSGKVTAEEVFFRALLNITQLSNNIYGNASTEWQRNALNYDAAVNTLEALAGPFLGDDYFDRVEDMEGRATRAYTLWKERTPKQQLVKMGRDMEVKLTLEIANARLSLIQDVLHAKGIFFGRTYQATPGGDEAAPEFLPDPEEPVPGLDDPVPEAANE